MIHKQFSDRQYKFGARSLDYRLTSIHRLDSYSGMYGGPIELNVGKSAVRAELTTEPNAAFKAVDQTRAFREIRFSEEREYADTRELWEAITSRADGHASERSKDAEKWKSKGIGYAYLSIEIDGQVEVKSSGHAWNLDYFIMASELVDVISIRKKHATDVAQVLTALSIALADQAQYVRTLVETVTFSIRGTPVFHTARPDPPTDLRAIGLLPVSKAAEISSIATKMVESPEWEKPLTLLADAMRTTHDELECFVLAYASIEMMIAKLTSGFASGDWVNRVVPKHLQSAIDLHEATKRRERTTYTFSEKLSAIQLLYGLGDDVLEQLTSLKVGVREPLFHRGRLPERIPVEKTLHAAAALLRAALGHE